MPVQTRAGIQPISIGHLAGAKLMSALLSRPQSIESLATKTGLTWHTVMRYIRALRQEKACFIEHWSVGANGRINVANYSLGSRPDAKRPRKPRAKVVADWKAKRVNRQCNPESLKWARSIVEAHEKRERGL